MNFTLFAKHFTHLPQMLRMKINIRNITPILAKSYIMSEFLRTEIMNFYPPKNERKEW